MIGKLRNGEWLTDKHINAARSLLKEQFPLQQGLQDTILLQHGKYDSGINCLVQVIHINGNHWVCVSNKFSPKGTVDVLDCSSGNGNSTSLKRQLAIILKCRSAFFRVRHVEVQRQTGYADCGIFAIAFAYTLCSGLDPHTIHYNQALMRPHFELCIDNEKFAMFLTSGQTTRKRLKFVKIVDIFCTCRMPWDKDDVVRGPMVQCCKCKEWYRENCCNINMNTYITKEYICDKC